MSKLGIRKIDIYDRIGDDNHILDTIITAVEGRGTFEALNTACQNLLEAIGPSPPMAGVFPRFNIISAVIEKVLSTFQSSLGARSLSGKVLEWFSDQHNREVNNHLIAFAIEGTIPQNSLVLREFETLSVLASATPRLQSLRMEILLQDLYKQADEHVELHRTLYERMQGGAWQTELLSWAKRGHHIHRIPCAFLLDWPDRDEAFTSLWNETKYRLEDSCRLGRWSSSENEGALRIFTSVRESLFSLLLGKEMKIAESWNRHVILKTAALDTLFTNANRGVRELDQVGHEWFFDFGLCVIFLATLALDDPHYTSYIGTIQQTSRQLLQWCRLRGKANQSLTYEMAFAIEQTFWSYIRGEDPTKFLLDGINTIRFLPVPCVAVNLKPNPGMSAWAIVASVSLERLRQTRPHEKRELYSRELRIHWADKLFELLKKNSETNAEWRICYLESFLQLKVFNDGRHSRIGFFKQLHTDNLPNSEKDLIAKIISSAVGTEEPDDSATSYPMVMRAYWIHLRTHAIVYEIDIDHEASERWLQSIMG